ncbi:Uncharacterised protein [Legionella lansingensis]|uniref:Uncharacterized protein n=1 Tax=Legionella lansingensis TaxID=45067 RepID=A0A0W0VJI0_9GAMM|nr:hypothetical protein [Legionella lansingensis]KTD20273.1 hypothetical protein Llan_1924 [Legionella lansingensis]SNV50282.1 Uncharacterised protein [Legionella lansingensis]
MRLLFCKSLADATKTAVTDATRVTVVTGMVIGAYSVYDRLANRRNGFFSDSQSQSPGPSETVENLSKSDISHKF